jgi:hypothetical protein
VCCRLGLAPNVEQHLHQPQTEDPEFSEIESAHETASPNGEIFTLEKKPTSSRCFSACPPYTPCAEITAQTGAKKCPPAAARPRRERARKMCSHHCCRCQLPSVNPSTQAPTYLGTEVSRYPEFNRPQKPTPPVTGCSRREVINRGSEGDVPALLFKRGFVDSYLVSVESALELSAGMKRQKKSAPAP